MPKQSSSFSSPSEMAGSSSSSSSSEESATEDFEREARSCSIALKYSSSVLALARRAWTLDFCVRNVPWALMSFIPGCKYPWTESQFWIWLVVNLVLSSNFDHHLTLKVLWRI